MISNLRILGIIIGLVGLVYTFVIFRGPKWKKTNFILLSIINICLLSVSFNPNFVNVVRDMLALKEFQYGRLLALLVISNLFLLFCFLNSKSNIERLRIQFDKLIRNLGATDLEGSTEVEKSIKPIMVVMPAYNEGKNLGELLPHIPQQIRKLDVGVLVVNDASEDNTVDIAQKHGKLVVTSRINRGQGATSRLGYDILIKNSVLVGVTMDADNQHRPEDLEKVISPILDGKYDLVIGSRMLGQQEYSDWFRNIGIIGFSKILSFVIGLRITDCSSGFKAFNIEKLRSLNLTEDQFQSAEVLIEASKKGLRIREVPVTINRRKYGESKKGTDWRYGLEFSKVILKTWWRG
jgi:hypothetical protein